MSSSEFVIQFPVPPRAVFLAGTAGQVRTCSHDELEAACKLAHQQGASEAMELMERQMLELRADVLHLQSRTFSELAAAHAGLIAQFRELLPELVAEAASRVLASTPMSRDTVAGIVRELLRGIEPGSQELEVRLAQGDLDLIAGLDAEFREKHPSITFRADADLKPGDCVVQSRFGTLDGRVASKLQLCKEALHAA
ncbi:MAG: FliH/SctL family protein [Chthoniobacteraceae bacterium]